MGWKDNPVVYLIRKRWEFSEGSRHLVILSILFFIFANAANLLNPLLVALILNTIQEQGVTSDNLYTLIFYFSLFIGIWVLFWIFHWPARFMETKNGFLIRANYKRYLLNGVMGLPLDWHADHHSGDTIDKVNKGTQSLYVFSSNMFELMEGLILFFGALIILTMFHLHSLYIVLGMTLVTFIIIMKFDKVLVKKWDRLHKAENKISAKVFDIISNITTVAILRIENLVSNSMFKQIMEPFKLHVRTHKVNEAKWFVVTICVQVMVFLVLSSYLYFSFKAGAVILVGTVYLLYGYVDKISSQFYRFAYMYGTMVEEKVAIENVEEVAREFKKKKKVKSYPLDKWKSLNIDNLSFSYHADDKEGLHLDNVSVSINRSEKVALIGESGGGKTTFLKVFRDLYHPKSLDLTIDGVKMKKGFKNISSSISLIPQDPEIFNSTIKENITMGVKHNMKYITRFTDLARFTNVAMKLPKKFNSSIVEKGVNLSGGQKQRLALARGLMASEKKEIWLLDEPTSSVDVYNELLIYTNIFEKYKGKTILSSIHRLHLLLLFDKILFFKGGKLVDQGNFEELLKKSKLFKELWKEYNKSHNKHLTEALDVKK